MFTSPTRYSAREAAVLAARLAAMRERLAELHVINPDSILIEPLERCIPDLADTVAAMRTSIDFAGAISEDEDRARVIANETAEAETLGRLLCGRQAHRQARHLRHRRRRGRRPRARPPGRAAASRAAPFRTGRPEAGDAAGAHRRTPDAAPLSASSSPRARPGRPLRSALGRLPRRGP